MPTRSSTDRTGNKMSTTDIKKKEYPGLDVLRIICAVLVVTIHFAPFGPWESVQSLNYRFVQYFSRDAVPLFFMMSSFFFFKRVINDGRIDMRESMTKCFSYFKQYLLWTVIYLFMIIKNYTHGRETIAELIRDFFFCGSYFHLWFMPALITGLIVVSCLYKWGLSSKKIFVISIFLYMIGLLGQSYYGLLSGVRENVSWFASLSEIYFKIFTTTRNGLFEATLFVSLGLLLSEQKAEAGSFNSDEDSKAGYLSSLRIKYIISIIVLLIINIAEVEFVNAIGLAREADFYIMTPVICWFIFKLASSYKLPDSYTDEQYASYKKRSYYIRNITMLVYFLQIYVGMFIKDGLNFITHGDAGSYYLFPPVLIVSTVAAWFITMIKYKMKNKKDLSDR